jgi:hypothetical protein
MDSQKLTTDDKTLIVLTILFVAVIFILCGLLIKDTLSDKDRAETFCSNMNMTYSFDQYQACYIDDATTRYIIKIVRIDDGYKLLDSSKFSY